MPMMILCYDTSNQGASLLLADDDGGNVLMQRHEVSRQFSLPNALATLFADYDATPKQVTKIVVTLGPGSYMGIRGGLAVLEAYRLALPDIVYHGISNMDLSAWILCQQQVITSHIGVIAETKRKDYFWQIFDENAQKISPTMICDAMICEPMICDGEEIAEKIIAHCQPYNGDIFLTGTAINRFTENHAINAPYQPLTITAQHLLDFHLACPEHGKYQRAPLYLKEADVTLPKARKTKLIFLRWLFRA